MVLSHCVILLLCISSLVIICYIIVSLPHSHTKGQCKYAYGLVSLIYITSQVWDGLNFSLHMALAWSSGQGEILTGFCRTYIFVSLKKWEESMQYCLRFSLFTNKCTYTHANAHTQTLFFLIFYVGFVVSKNQKWSDWSARSGCNTTRTVIYINIRTSIYHTSETGFYTRTIYHTILSARNNPSHVLFIWQVSKPPWLFRSYLCTGVSYCDRACMSICLLLSVQFHPWFFQWFRSW